VNVNRQGEAREILMFWLDKRNSIWISECSSILSSSNTSVSAKLDLGVLNNETFAPESGCHVNLTDYCSRTDGGFLAILSVPAGTCAPAAVQPEKSGLSAFQISMIVLGCLLFVSGAGMLLCHHQNSKR
jgi:hypothetical protein